MESLLAQVQNPILRNELQPLTNWEYFNAIAPSWLSLGFLVAALVFIFIFIIGSFEWITSGSDKGKLESARGKISNSIVGLLVLLLIWLIIQFVNFILGINIGLIGGLRTGTSSTGGPPPTTIAGGPTSPPTSTCVCSAGAVTSSNCGTGTATCTGVNTCVCMAPTSAFPTTTSAPPVCLITSSVSSCGGGGCAPTEVFISTEYSPQPECCTSQGLCNNSGCQTNSSCTVVTAACGNGAVESGEICDDGNTNSGDGCASDCLRSCTDSDGGVDTFVAGNIIEVNAAGTLGRTDSCQTGSSLTEYYCDANDYLASNTVNCVNGCSNGVCLSSPGITPTSIPPVPTSIIPTNTPIPTSTPIPVQSFCTDSDFGPNYFVFGYVSENTSNPPTVNNWFDVCASSTMVTERQCNGDTYYFSDINCPSTGATVCQNGECCVPPASACSVDADCCAGNICQAGVCRNPSNIILNSASGISCIDACWNAGYRTSPFVSSVGTDPLGSNGMMWSRGFSGTCSQVGIPVNRVMDAEAGVCDDTEGNPSVSYQTQWTKCRCI
ncbi:MAG TPA: hypothetical protein VI819_04855 [Patescibacteria group bacterium]|nr:hypothetical protein [Patescibacteria group bacterium]